MALIDFTARVLDKLVREVRWLRRGAMLLAGAVVVADLLKDKAYSRFPWDGIPAFTAIYALLGALALIGLYKLIGYGLVYRKPDYYARGEDGPGMDGDD
jgi:hypothetical protein